MTIRRANEYTELKQGDFILGAGFGPYHLVGNAGKVTSISGKRIYYDRFHEDVIDSTHMNASQVRFVCDTKEEVDALLALSNRKYRETSAAVKEIEAKFEGAFEAQLKAMIGATS